MKCPTGHGYAHGIHTHSGHVVKVHRRIEPQHLIHPRDPTPPDPLWPRYGRKKQRGGASYGCRPPFMEARGLVRRWVIFWGKNECRCFKALHMVSTSSMVCCAFKQISADICRYLQISCHASRYLVTSVDICHPDLIPADRRNVERSFLLLFSVL
jgi:hypothetical protein